MMSFFQSVPAFDSLARRVLFSTLEEGRVDPETVAMTWLLDRPGEGVAGFRHRGGIPLYPASVIKLFYLAAFMRLAEAGELTETEEDLRALTAMIRVSSNEATGHVVDRLTGTTGGPDLPPDDFETYVARREAVQRQFRNWKWPELRDVAIRQKTYSDGPYGREWSYRQRVPGNVLTTDATARLLHAIAGGEIAGPERTGMMMDMLDRSFERPAEAQAADPENQVTGFLVEGTPAAIPVWSKAGWTSVTRHDAVLARLPNGATTIIVMFGNGPERARDREFLPALARSVFAALA